MNKEQKKILLQYLKEFLKNPYIVNEGKREKYESFDQKRIDSFVDLGKIVDGFLSGKLSMVDFKEQHELACRKFPYWGFKSFSGQMQLSQFIKNIDFSDKSDKEDILRQSILVPRSNNEAQKKIDSMVEYIKKARELSSNPRALPRPVSVGYMLSYFWEIQNNQRWPVYYHSTKKVLQDLDLHLDDVDSLGKEYMNFVGTYNKIVELYKKHTKEKIKYPFWLVEYVLWNQFNQTGIIKMQAEKKIKKDNKLGKIKNIDEWIPAVVNDLSELSFNKETDWSKKRNIKPEKAFETKLRYILTLLGYEVSELGQGTGRQPDGIAISLNVDDGDHYAIVYDAKARENHFNVGTSDREIYEYIQTKSRELSGRRINKMYFLIVSSEFNESPANTDSIMNIFRRTHVPVILLRASDLLLILEIKLKNVGINHTKLEELLLNTGILTREKITEVLGDR